MKIKRKDSFKHYSLAIVAMFLVGKVDQVPAKKTRDIPAAAENWVNSGFCTLPDGAIAPDISTKARLTHADDEWAMAMETLGANSAGAWFINFSKNGVGGPSMLESFNPPGGWSVVGNHIDKGAAKDKYLLSAKATKYANPIIVCEVTIAMQENQK